MIKYWFNNLIKFILIKFFLKKKVAEKKSDFYDTRLERVSLDLENSPWNDVYHAAFSFLPNFGKNYLSILDIGCGTGRFASFFKRRQGCYNGIDFSKERINLAKKYYPNMNFLIKDINTSDTEFFNRFNSFIILEVLEHLNKDLELLKKLPLNSTVIFSVPNYHSQGHVRIFNTIKDIKKRYSKFLDIVDFHILPRKRRGRVIFLVKSIRL